MKTIIVGIWSLMPIYSKRSGRDIYGRYFVKIQQRHMWQIFRKDLREVYLVDYIYQVVKSFKPIFSKLKSYIYIYIYIYNHQFPKSTFLYSLYSFWYTYLKSLIKHLANISPWIFSVLFFVFILIECVRCCAILTIMSYLGCIGSFYRGIRPFSVHVISFTDSIPCSGCIIQPLAHRLGRNTSTPVSPSTILERLISQEVTLDTHLTTLALTMIHVCATGYLAQGTGPKGGGELRPCLPL